MQEVTPEACENRTKIADIRCRLLHGLITYEQARTEAEPTLARMNARGAEIARKQGLKYRPLKLGYLLR